MTVLAATSTSGQHTQTIITIISGVIVILGAILAGGRWVIRRYLGPLGQLAENAPELVEMAKEWMGDPGKPERGISPRPGFPERFTSVELDLGAVKAQLTNNGGSSVKDQVEKTLAAVTSNNTAQAAHAASHGGGA